MLRVKYERAMADLEFAKRRLLEQHEEDLEQTMVLKKQMEKKVRAVMAVKMSMMMVPMICSCCLSNISSQRFCQMVQKTTLPNNHHLWLY